MQISNELKEKIERYFFMDEEFKNKLLSGVTDAIREVGSMAQKRIAPEDVIEAYENEEMDYLYKKAKKMVELQKMYKELCDSYDSYILNNEEDTLEER